MNGNGTGRLDRIERILENLAERMDMIVDHHDREFKALLKWQVAMQGQIEDLIRVQQADHAEQTAIQKTLREEMAASSRALDQRIEKLVSAIGQLIEGMEHRRQ